MLFFSPLKPRAHIVVALDFQFILKLNAPHDFLTLKITIMIYNTIFVIISTASSFQAVDVCSDHSKTKISVGYFCLIRNKYVRNYFNPIIIFKLNVRMTWGPNVKVNNLRSDSWYLSKSKLNLNHLFFNWNVLIKI